MTTITAARLIELLAQHIAEQGNVHVAMPYQTGDWGEVTSVEYVGVVRCWWNDERKCIVIGSR